jgi:hypothetical protein
MKKALTVTVTAIYLSSQHKRIGYACFASPKEAKAITANDDVAGTLLGIFCHQNAQLC